MKNFKLDRKIIWRRPASTDCAQAFYPSFYKDIIKRDSFFKENFKVEIVNADTKKLKNIFIPLYLDEVANRPDFTLDKENIATILSEKLVASPNYKFLFVYDKDEVVTAILFALKNNGLHLAYKANRKYFDKTLSHKATISYWTEKLIFEYGIEQGVSFFSYGKDSNPYFGRTRIGLSLYKIKTGMKPRRPEVDSSFPITDFDEQSFLSKKEPLLFFGNPDESSYYQDCFLYYPEGSISASYLKEFEKIFNWSGINLFFISY